MDEVNFIQAEKREETADKRRKKSREREQENSESTGVNLMTKEAIEEGVHVQLRSHAKKLLLSAAAAVLVTLFLFFVVEAYGFVIQKNADQLQINLGKIDQEITELEKQSPELIQFQNKLAATKSLFDAHAHWSQFIAELEKKTLPTITYAGLSVTSGSPLSLSASAPDFKTLAKQLLSFQQATNLMSSVHVTAGNAMLNQFGDIAGVSFEIAFSLNPEILKKKTQ